MKYLKLWVCSLCLVAACGTQAKSLAEEAEQFCGLYDKQHWAHLSEEAVLQDIYQVILTKYHEAKFSDAFVKATSGQNSKNLRDYYYATKSKLDGLLKKKWQCEQFDDFYMPKQQVVNLQLNGSSEERIDIQKPGIFVIGLTADGAILLNEKELANNERDTIIKATKHLLKTRKVEDVRFVIYHEAQVAAQPMNQLLEILGSLGAKKVSLILSE